MVRLGIVFGISGLLLASLVSMEIAASRSRCRSRRWPPPSSAASNRSVVTVMAGFVIGLLQSELNAFRSLAEYRNTVPFISAIVVLVWFGWRRQRAGPSRLMSDVRRRPSGCRRSDTAADTDLASVTAVALRRCGRWSSFCSPAVFGAFWMQIMFQCGAVLRRGARASACWSAGPACTRCARSRCSLPAPGWRCASSRSSSCRSRSSS